MIREILLATPAWVYLLFVLLLWLGVCQLRPRAVPVRRIWRTPMVFILWGLCGLAMRNTDMLTSTAPWLIAASVGLLFGVARRNTLAIDHARRLVMRPASVLPLLRNFMIFAAHYALNVAAALRPDQHEIMQVDMALSGVFAGFFLGWLIRFVQRYRESAGTSSDGGSNLEVQRACTSGTPRLG